MNSNSITDIVRQGYSHKEVVKDAQYLNYRDNHFDGAIFSYNGIGYIPRKEGKLKFLNILIQSMA